MKAPSLWTLESLFKSAQENHACIDGQYVPARPIGLDSYLYRAKLAMMVFMGKADAVTWPKGQ